MAAGREARQVSLYQSAGFHAAGAFSYGRWYRVGSARTRRALSATRDVLFTKPVPPTCVGQGDFDRVAPDFARFLERDDG